MRVAFRTDASTRIGTGHVMRCLTLADVMRERGAECLFVCREHSGHLLELIAGRGHSATTLPMSSIDMMHTQNGTESIHYDWLGARWEIDAAETLLAVGNEPIDWFVVDHYALDYRWERTLRQRCRRLMVIDDLADRSHDCDLLLDQNLGRSAADYANLVAATCKLLVGPEYALLRPEFAALRSRSLLRRSVPGLRRLLVTMGGVDQDDVTGRVLDALSACSLPPELQLTVVMGLHAPWLEEVRVRAANMPCPTDVLIGVTNMAQLMAASDMAIGAAGGTTWERCCMGLPTIQLVLALNQLDIAKALAHAGAALYADDDNLVDVLTRFFSDHAAAEYLRTMGITASSITDGLGAARVAAHIFGDLN